MKGDRNKVNLSEKDGRRYASVWLCATHTKFIYALGASVGELLAFSGRGDQRVRDYFLYCKNEKRCQ
jgi:hypothetical protein